MSPPATAAAAGAARARAQVAPGRARPRPAPRPAPRPRQRPRRVSGPTPTTSPQGQGLALGVLHAIETVSTHRLLDRLIRSRAWIGLIAFALIGIVALQLGLLKLNSGIGRSLERQALLQRENASLSIENSELASGDRVEEQAKRLGMALVSERALRFLSAHPRSDLAHAVSALRTPVQHGEAVSAPSGGGSSSSEGASEAEATTTEASSAPSSEASRETPPAAPAPGEAEPTTSTTSTPTTTAPSGGEAEAASANGGTQAAPGG